MSRCIITRTNGIVTQVWEHDPNNASWSFFLGGMSNDVQWHNINGREFARQFDDWDQAKWYLDTRAKRLKGSMKKKEADWEYHILEEVER